MALTYSEDGPHQAMFPAHAVGARSPLDAAQVPLYCPCSSSAGVQTTPFCVHKQAGDWVQMACLPVLWLMCDAASESAMKSRVMSASSSFSFGAE